MPRRRSAHCHVGRPQKERVQRLRSHRCRLPSDSKGGSAAGPSDRSRASGCKNGRQHRCGDRVIRTHGSVRRCRRALSCDASAAAARGRPGGTGDRGTATIPKRRLRRGHGRSDRTPLERPTCRPEGAQPGGPRTDRLSDLGPVERRLLVDEGLLSPVSGSGPNAPPSGRATAERSGRRASHPGADSARLCRRLPGVLLASPRGISEPRGTQRHLELRDLSGPLSASATGRTSRQRGMATTIRPASRTRGTGHRVSVGGGPSNKSLRLRAAAMISGVEPALAAADEPRALDCFVSSESEIRVVIALPRGEPGGIHSISG